MITERNYILVNNDEKDTCFLYLYLYYILGIYKKKSILQNYIVGVYIITIFYNWIYFNLYRYVSCFWWCIKVINILKSTFLITLILSTFNLKQVISKCKIEKEFII